MKRFVVSYARLKGTQVRSRTEEFDNIAEAALFFNKMCLDEGKNLSITICDTKVNAILKHYVHNHFPYRHCLVTEAEDSEQVEPAEQVPEGGEPGREEEPMPSPEEYKDMTTID